jgi:hypothetical protein
VEIEMAQLINFPLWSLRRCPPVLLEESSRLEEVAATVTDVIFEGDKLQLQIDELEAALARIESLFQAADKSDGKVLGEATLNLRYALSTAKRELSKHLLSLSDLSHEIKAAALKQP